MGLEILKGEKSSEIVQVLRRNWNKLDDDHLGELNCFLKKNFESVSCQLLTSDTNRCAEIVHEKVVEALNTFLPLKPSEQGAKKTGLTGKFKNVQLKSQLWNRYLTTKSQSDEEAYEKQSQLLRKKIRGKVIEFYEKQIMTETRNRNRKHFHFVNKVVNINGDEKTVEKNAVEDLDKFNSFFATIGAKLAKKNSFTKTDTESKTNKFNVFQDN